MLCAPYFNALTLATGAVFLEVFLTGGLHLDGLADTFDGLYSNRGKERILEIMKDSRIGSNGALALIMVLLVKIALLTNIGTEARTVVLVFLPAVSRFCVPFAGRISRYARENGMGAFFIGSVTTGQVVVSGVLLGLSLLLYPAGFLPLAAVIVFAVFYVRHVTAIIGGMTGDTLGALIELSEIVQLPFWILALRWFAA